MAQDALLDRECALLYRQVFGGSPPPGLSELYRRAHATVLPQADGSPEAAALAEAVRRNWDLEALEFALRRRDKGNLLSRKLNLLFYAAEASPEHFDRFVNLQDRRLRGWLALGAQVFRALYRLPKGWFLAQRLASLKGRHG